MYDQIRDCDGKDEMKKRKRNDNRGGEIVCLFLGHVGDEGDVEDRGNEILMCFSLSTT